MGDDGPNIPNNRDPGVEGHLWDHRGGKVTLNGNAAHPMTFQQGQGLNLAITGALALRYGTVGAWKVWMGMLVEEQRAEMVGEYCDEMGRRADVEVMLSARNTQMLHDWETVVNSPVVKSGLNQETL